MLLHRVCHKQVTVGFTQRLVGDITISRNGLTVLNVEPGGVVGDTSFFCTTCNTAVLQDAIVANCMMCGATFPISELHTPRLSGGLYCQEHAVEYFSDEGSRPSSTLISQIRVNVAAGGRNNR